MEIQHYRRDRNYGDEERLGTIENAPLENALETLLKFELGFGGKVTAASKTSLEVTTPVLAKIDRTVFLGTEEEMDPLLQVIGTYFGVQKQVGDQVTDTIGSHLVKITKGNPFLITNLFPIERGTSLTKMALVCLLTNDEEEALSFKGKDLEELILLYGEKVRSK